MTDELEEKMYGCIIGGAIGDALGAVVEGSSYDRIRNEYGKIREFKPYDLPYSGGDPGMVTDDTVIRSHLCTAIDTQQGRITPDEYAAVLTTDLDTEDVWVPEEIVHKKLLLGMNPWTTGREQIPSSIMASAIQPVGAINAGNPRQAYQDAMNVASVHQDGTHRDSAATIAAGVAEAFAPDASLDTVLDTMRNYAPDILSRGIDLTVALARESDSCDDFAEAYYDELLDWRWPAERWSQEKYENGLLFSDTTLESVPIAFALLDLCGGDVEQSIVEAASFGRNCDAIASIAGSISGTLTGATAIPAEWVTQCETANEPLFDATGFTDFKDMADCLVSALEAEAEAVQTRTQELDTILNE